MQLDRLILNVHMENKHASIIRQAVEEKSYEVKLALSEAHCVVKPL